MLTLPLCLGKRWGWGALVQELVEEMKIMASDSSGGLHYSGDVTEEIRDPLLTYTNPHN